MVKHYKPTGDDKVGWRIAIPAIVVKADRYTCEYLKDGTLVYRPVKL